MKSLSRHLLDCAGAGLVLAAMMAAALGLTAALSVVQTVAAS